MPKIMMSQHDSIRAVEWNDNHLVLLDQRKLPHHEHYVQLYSAEDTAEAIRNRVVRGAPAIGIAAAYAVVMAARKSYKQYPQDWLNRLMPEVEMLRNARPTAVNLVWALNKMCGALDGFDGNPEEPLLALAKRIHQDDIDANSKMGELGSALIGRSYAVLTHCNTGSLATGGYGTALGVIRSAFHAGQIEQVYACETRPWWQGARLTAWELAKDKIPTQLLCDSAAAHLMQQGKIAWVVVGADRVVANGDFANKIGTYSLAVNARYHGVKFMVVASTSTIDLQTTNGSSVPIEERAQDEILSFGNQRVTIQNAQAWNPTFDITPASLVDALVTEKGVIEHPNAEKIAALMAA